MIRRIVLRHLAFAGKGIEPAVLKLEDGVNVVYGASNTGKSFTVDAIDFMLGAGDPLSKDIEQLASYEDVMLGMTLPGLGDVTLSRGVAGGNLQLFTGLHFAKPSDVQPRKLAAKHSGKNREANLSALLLDLLGFEALEVVKKSTTGEKNSFTFRSVAPFALVKEGAMLSTDGPAFSNNRREASERSIFKAFLTGVDDSAIVAMVDPKISKARVSGKVEFVDEMLARIEESLGAEGPGLEQLAGQLENLDNELEDLEEQMKERQAEVDRLTAVRRATRDAIDAETREVGELHLSIARFTELSQVYQTDLMRLALIEEGGVVLLAMTSRPCPLCGAMPEHQHHDHGVAEAQATYDAAKLEIAKITRDQTLLASTSESLQAEVRGKAAHREELLIELRRVEQQLDLVRPQEASMRSAYESLSIRRREVSGRIDLMQDKSRWVARKQTLLTESASAPKSLKLMLGPSGPAGHDLAQAIQGVLSDWGYPGNVAVSFDLEALDIRLNGKIRTANGKGVRALLHAAFNVGLLIHCREKGLPHPGFLVLDTPLLTYREPEKNAKFEPIEDEEKALRASGLLHKFFEHLHSLKDVQFLIL